MTIQEFIEKVGRQVPWERGEWYGQFLTFDDTPTHEFGPEDIESVLAADQGTYNTCAAIIQLKDKRWVAWESFWDVTGDGFHYDAYGGNVNVYFSQTIAHAIMYGLTPEGREILKLDIENWSNPNAQLPTPEPITHMKNIDIQHPQCNPQQLYQEYYHHLLTTPQPEELQLIIPATQWKPYQHYGYPNKDKIEHIKHIGISYRQLLTTLHQFTQIPEPKWPETNPQIFQLIITWRELNYIKIWVVDDIRIANVDLHQPT